MTLRIAIPDLVSPSYFPAIAAVELGLFRAQGLDATIELIGPVARTLEALRDGAVDYVGGSAHAPLLAFEDWSGARLLCALSQNMYWFLVVRHDVDAARGDLNALRGLRIGAAPGPADGLRRLLRDAGIDPQTDLNIAPVPGAFGGSTSFGMVAADALAAGLIDGFWANGMGCEAAVRSGAGRLLLDARRGDGGPGSVDHTFAALITTARRIEEDPQQVICATRAIIGAQQALKADPALATKAALRLFPAAETALISDLVRQDTPFYDAAISRQKIDALNAFARELGLLKIAPPYEQIVPALARSVW